MKAISVTVTNPTGLHARPARIFVDTAKKFKSAIRVRHGEKTANAKSMISLLSLGVEQGAKITIIAEGDDEDKAIAELVALVSTGMGEGEEQVSPAPVGAAVATPVSHITPGEQDNVIRGLPAAPGMAIGFLWQWRAPAPLQPRQTFRSVAEEQETLSHALAEADLHLRRLAQKMAREVGPEEAAIFEAHLEILHDPDLLAEVHGRIEEGVSASQAWYECIEARAEHLAGVRDRLLAARAADIRDVGRLVLRLLLGVDEERPALPAHPVILVSEDLSPSDIANVDLRRVLGICTAKGTPTAHVAILARALGLPAIVGAGNKVLSLSDGTLAILDGDQGILVMEPDKSMLDKARAALERRREIRQRAEQEATLPAITVDGHRVEVAANIASPEEAKEAARSGAEAIGLLRTEFLFLNRNQPPTEEEQHEIYRKIADLMRPSPVIVRTLDVGGDKHVPYLALAEEANPFLGVRGVRLSLRHPELFRQQLRAILQAAAHGALRVMFPMVTTLEDWQQARAVFEQVAAEVGSPPIPVGIMVEVPAVAIMADAFAREVDFFSIGTNDLTQYTLAMDRQHEQLAAQADGLHPAVLRLIERTVEAAHAAGKWVGVCGELAADPDAIPILVGLGVDELSVAVASVPIVKAHVRRLNFEQCREAARRALECTTAAEVRRLARELREAYADVAAAQWAAR